VEDLVRTATLGSYGVTGFAGNLVERGLGAAGLGQPGLRVGTTDGLTVELDLTVAHGLPIAEVARQVDSAVRYSIRLATGREIDRLTIHVDGLRWQPGAPTDQLTGSPARADPSEPRRGRRRTRQRGPDGPS
jgi:uncharacterized alkaline shock family protein YloU